MALTETRGYALISRALGTDATIAQHIQMIIDRDYVIERMEGATKFLIPSKLGIGLIEGYNQIGLNKSLSKPQLRREVCNQGNIHHVGYLKHSQTERSMVQVCQGAKSKADMLEETIVQYKEMFIIARREFEKVVLVRSFIFGAQEICRSFCTECPSIP